MSRVSDLFSACFRVSPLRALFLGRVIFGSFKTGPAPPRPPGSAPVSGAQAGRLLGSVQTPPGHDGERGSQGRRATAEPAKLIQGPGPPAAGAAGRMTERPRVRDGGWGGTPLFFKGDLGGGGPSRLIVAKKGLPIP